MNRLDDTRLTVSRFVAVAAAGRHGRTEEIADCLVDRLRMRLPEHWSVIRCLPSDPLLEVADAVVLGSAVYLDRWMPTARACLQRLQRLGPEDLWIFSAGPVSDEHHGQRDHFLSPEDVAWVREHKVFGGPPDYTRLSTIVRFLTRMVGALQGDHNWSEIDDWADAIAAHLASTYGEHNPGSGHLIAAGGASARLDPRRWSMVPKPFARVVRGRSSTTA